MSCGNKLVKLVKLVESPEHESISKHECKGHV